MHNTFKFFRTSKKKMICITTRAFINISFTFMCIEKNIDTNALHIDVYAYICCFKDDIDKDV